MAKLPGFMFYPGDWLKEPSLRRCSHAAKGVYIDILCLMFECDERGVLSTAGRAWGDQEVARAIGGQYDVTLACIQELADLGVVSRSTTGALYCRRMVRDENKRKLCSDAGKRGGGNPQFSKGHCKGDNKGPPNGAPEYESENEIANETSAEDSFDRFWGLYPRKVGKRDARGAWDKAVAAIRKESGRSTSDAIALIEKATATFANSDKAKSEFCPHPATWLNQGRYEDDPAAWSEQGGKPKHVPLSQRGKT
jgi:hypothetical protein